MLSNQKSPHLIDIDFCSPEDFCQMWFFSSMSFSTTRSTLILICYFTVMHCARIFLRRSCEIAASLECDICPSNAECFVCNFDIIFLKYGVVKGNVGGSEYKYEKYRDIDL